MRQNGVRPARFRFKVGGRVGKMGGGKMVSGKQRKDEASGFYSPDMGMKGGKMFKKGTLKIGGSDKKVKNRKQAIAIALNQAGIKNRRKNGRKS